MELINQAKEIINNYWLIRDSIKEKCRNSFNEQEKSELFSLWCQLININKQ